MPFVLSDGSGSEAPAGFSTREKAEEYVEAIRVLMPPLAEGLEIVEVDDCDTEGEDASLALMKDAAAGLDA